MFDTFERFRTDQANENFLCEVLGFRAVAHAPQEIAHQRRPEAGVQALLQFLRGNALFFRAHRFPCSREPFL
jgi:hypothetical protein